MSCTDLEGSCYNISASQVHGPDRAKACLMPYANNKGADQPAHHYTYVFATEGSLLGNKNLTKVEKSIENYYM